jgi:purine-binding chemotaxis protein CheW
VLVTALHVSFRVGAADYVIPATQVLHLEAYEGATHVPGTPRYVAGLVQVRGRVVPVIDLRLRFGLEPTPRSLDHRVVVVQDGARVVGLLVDSAREVVQIDPSAFEKPPEIVEQQTSGFIKAVATVTTTMWLLVDVPRVIGAELIHG